MELPICPWKAARSPRKSCNISEYLPSLTRWKKAFHLEYLSDLFFAYCLDTKLSVYQMISVNGKYLWVIFNIKDGKKF